MKQSRKGSVAEVLTSTAIGYLVAVTSQILIFPLYDVHLPVAANFVIGLWFTIISVARSYVVRRLFNRFNWFSK